MPQGTESFQKEKESPGNTTESLRNHHGITLGPSRNHLGNTSESPSEPLRNHPGFVHNVRNVLSKRSQQPQQAKWKVAFRGERSVRVGAPAKNDVVNLYYFIG